MSKIQSQPVHEIEYFQSGVISRGLKGWSPLVKIIVHFGRLSPANSFAYVLLFKVH